jgi:hypothetical protein
MRRNGLRLTIPNPHGGAIDPGLIRRMLRQVGSSISQRLNA